MRADYTNGYYYISNESGVLRVKADELENFVKNFEIATMLNNSIGITGCRVVEKPTKPVQPSQTKDCI